MDDLEVLRQQVISETSKLFEQVSEVRETLLEQIEAATKNVLLDAIKGIGDRLSKIEGRIAALEDSTEDEG